VHHERADVADLRHRDHSRRCLWITLKPVFGVLAFLLLVIVTPWPDEVEE
jgi:hypothetical protein